jgi:hypothetical protein
MLQFVFCKINIWKLSGKSRIGAKEVPDLPPLQLVILDRPHARIWGQLHANVIALVKHNPSIEKVLYSILSPHAQPHTNAEISNFRSAAERAFKFERVRSDRALAPEHRGFQDRPAVLLSEEARGLGIGAGQIS